MNKIIRELWTATYKGEDITNIEIMTSMDAGSKAAKSYNYRVVMTKVRSMFVVPRAFETAPCTLMGPVVVNQIRGTRNST